MSYKIKIRILTPIPHSLTFGGIEMKSKKYIDYLSMYDDIDIGYLDYFNQDEEYDILHIIGASIDTARPALYAKRKGKKVVISPIWFKEYNLLFQKIANNIFQKLKFVPNSFSLVGEMLDECDLILNNNNGEKEQLKYIFSLNDKKFITIYNGIDTDMFLNIAKRNLFKKEYNLDKYILSVAMVDPRKNTLNLIKAFLEIDTDYKLVLMGDFRMFNKKYNQQVEQLINDNKERVIITGQIKHGSELMKSAYINADIHVLPSILETPGNSSMEACLAGCKVLVGECEPIREYFKNNIFYCNQYSVKDIKDKLEYLINLKSFNKKKQINYMIQYFAWEEQLKKLSNIYKEII